MSRIEEARALLAASPVGQDVDELREALCGLVADVEERQRRDCKETAVSDTWDDDIQLHGVMEEDFIRLALPDENNIIVHVREGSIEPAMNARICLSPKAALSLAKHLISYAEKYGR